MKIAVATTDGSRLSPHFGRSAGFVIFETDGTVVTSRELRPNRHTPHALGQCEGDHNHGSQSHHGHDHGGIATLLGDCEIILCGGIGQGAVAALQTRGIRTIVLPTPSGVEDAVQQYLSGTLSEGQPACNCSHSH